MIPIVEKPTISLNNTDCGIDEFYIHFKSSQLCDKFIANNNIEIGHRCCLGKGVLLKKFNNQKITSYEQIKIIEKTYNEL